MWHMGDGWGWWMAFGWLWMLLVIAPVVWAVARLAERRPGSGSDDAMRRIEPTAREVLDRRYAAGELTDEQYAAMRRQLSQPTGT